VTTGITDRTDQAGNQQGCCRGLGPGQAQLTGLTQPFAEDYNIHRVRLGCARYNLLFLLPQAAFLQASGQNRCPLMYFDLQSIIASVTPLS
jgi:hypothetical protein